MRSFLSRVVSRWKTRRLPRSDVDCSDFLRVCPEAPSFERLRQVVHERRFGGTPNGPVPLSTSATASAGALHREASLRSTVFDLRYRCGGAGRCIENDNCCRFPCCFAMRPVTKGAEVLAERLAYEVDDAPTPQIRALVRLARDEKLEVAIQGIQQLVDSKIREAAGGRVLCAALQQSEHSFHSLKQPFVNCDDEFSPAAAKYGSESAAEGINPLAENASLCEEVVALYLWRAALLVNMRSDAKAVNSLLNLAALVSQENRERLYASAATWAALNDMEIVYYRSLLQQYASFPIAETFANERPLLLQRVLRACAESVYLVQCSTHIVFSKEITATISRAQMAQMHNDISEDPMNSLCIPLALRYYRFYVSNEFWEHFLRLLCMPPVPAPETPEERACDPAEQLGLTPNHILDAVGRSILLHHLIMLHEAREREISIGAVEATVKKIKASGTGEDTAVHPSHYERVLSKHERDVAVARLRELLLLARSYHVEGASVSGRSESEKLE